MNYILRVLFLESCVHSVKKYKTISNSKNSRSLGASDSFEKGNNGFLELVFIPHIS